MEKHYCVIGDPIAHSLSPAIYTRLFARHHLDNCIYTRERVTKETLPAFIAACREKRICGFNVTMPLKEAVLPYLTYRDPSATFGANTVVQEVGTGLAGWSTDAAGFEESLKMHGRSLHGAHVVFLGCGGAARTLISAAIDKAAAVTIVNRTPAHARLFSDSPKVTIASFSDLTDHLPGCTLLVQTTPLGMAGTALQYSSLDFLAALPRTAFVADLIYSPAKTAFLEAAAKTGHEMMNGLGMLIWQACYAFEHFTGIRPDKDDFNDVAAALHAGDEK